MHDAAFIVVVVNYPLYTLGSRGTSSALSIPIHVWRVKLVQLHMDGLQKVLKRRGTYRKAANLPGMIHT